MKLTHAEEKQLVERAKADAQAFGELYDVYFDKLYSYVAFLVGNNADAEDIVGETFEKAMLNIKNFEWRGFTFGSWLYRVARNIVYDRSKARKILSLDEMEYFGVDPSSDTERQAENQIEIENLKEKLLNLSEEHREIIALRYIQEYSIKETCLITGKSVDSVKSMCKRAIAQLREEMGNE